MFAVEKKTLEAVLNYLGQRPWLEVKDLIPELLKAKPVTIQDEPSKPND